MVMKTLTCSEHIKLYEKNVTESIDILCKARICSKSTWLAISSLYSFYTMAISPHKKLCIRAKVN